jgi:Na+/H+ antiporter NhaD/arsenite permease-like protein
VAPPLLPLILFALTYLGVALGRIPGLALDRTGIALLGAVAFLASGRLTIEQAKDAIDVPTLAILFGLMLLSAQYQLSGLYAAIAERLARVRRPRRLLAAVVLATAALSAVLTNDVVCFALAPLLLAALAPAGLDPRPYLLALACAANVGSAATPIGNPQNILIATALDLGFARFVAACAVPVLASLLVVIAWFARRVPTRAAGDAAPALAPAAVDRGEAAKALLLTAVAIALFLAPVPMHLTALLVGGVVLTSRRMATRDMLALVDWHLLALFCGLVVVLRGLAVSGWIEVGVALLARAGGELREVAVLVPVVALLGNLVGNVPAVMLLLPLLPPRPDVGYALALASTLAGNAVLVGSVANLIVAAQAERAGVRIGFREHLRAGLPITVATLALAAVWLALL